MMHIVRRTEATKLQQLLCISQPKTLTSAYHSGLITHSGSNFRQRRTDSVTK